MTEDVAGRPRKFGIPYGSQTYTERITRTVHPDGTVIDSEPTRTAAGARWWALMQNLDRLARGLPEGTKQVMLQRTVTTEATGWTEVPRDEPDSAGVVSGD